MRRRLIALRTAMAEFGQDFDFGHGETDGYAEHLTRDPLPGTPRHSVLMTGLVRRPPGDQLGE